MKYSKVIDIEDFSNPELQPYLNRISEIEMARFNISSPVTVPDSKNWETAMAMRSFARSNLLKPGSTFAGIGAGTELLTELLAELGAIVFPTDRYLEETPWSDVAPAGYMVSTLPYNRFLNTSTNIIPVHSDARALDLPSNFFDGIYSSGSIEHFGGLASIEAAASEIGRILKPGGVASIATEFRLDGPKGQAWFDDNCILFTPEMIQKHIVEPSGLHLFDTPNNQPSRQTFKTRQNVVDFLNLNKKIKTYQDKLAAYPNLILHHLGFLFCSVHILLEKPISSSSISKKAISNFSFKNEVEKNNLAAIRMFSEKRAPRQSSQDNDVTSPKISNKNILKKFLNSLCNVMARSPRFKQLLLKILISGHCPHSLIRRLQNFYQNRAS